VHATLQPLHTTADVAEDASNSHHSTGNTQEQQVEFLEMAPDQMQIIRSPAPVDVNYIETVRSFLTRPYPVATGNWTGDNAYDFLLVNINPLGAYLSLNQILGKLQGFAYLRCGLRFEIRVNGTRFHFGQLVAGFTPLDGNLKTYNTAQLNAEALTMMPGVILDPGPSQVGIFEVPFVYPAHFLRLTEQPADLTLGRLRLRVLSPLRVVSETSVPRVSYTVYVSLVKPIINAFSAYPIATPPTAFEEQCSDSATRFVPENMNFLATDQNDVSVAAGTQGRNLVDHDEEVIALGREDMLLSTIYTKPNFILRTTWPTSASAAGVLARLNVYPALKATSGTFLNTLSRINYFWRGSLRYHLRVVASGFHSGRLLVTWEPSGNVSVPTLANATNRLSLVVDIQETTDVYFTIPYMQVEPWLRAGTETASLPNGQLALTILNPLATPSGDVGFVDMLMWQYGASDLEFAMPATTINQQGTLIFQEECLDAPLSDIKFGPLAGAFSVPGHMNMGEKLTSIKQMITKFAFGQLSTTTAPYSRLGWFESGIDAPTVTSHMKFLSAMYVYSRGSVKYAAIAFTDSATTIPVETYDVYPTFSEIPTASDPFFGQLVVTPATPNAMIQVPYCSELLFYTTYTTALSGPRPMASAAVRKAHTIRWYYAAGPDFMMGYLIPPPP
jgi:hypothetical protein